MEIFYELKEGELKASREGWKRFRLQL